MSNDHVRHVISLKRKQNPQMEYMWRVAMPPLSNIGVDKNGIISNQSLYPDGEASIIINGQRNVDNTEEINHRVYSVDLPFHSFENRKNIDTSKYFYTPLHRDLGSISMRIDEMEDGYTLKYLNAWQRLIRNENGTYNLPFIYKRNIVLYKKSSIGSEYHFSFYSGVYPSEISSSSHSYDSTGVLQYNVTFVCDEAEHWTESEGTMQSKNGIISLDRIRPPRYDNYEMNGDVLGAIGSIINKGIDFF